MLIRNTLLTLIVFGFASPLFAQTDQIVSHSKDITRGEIKKISRDEVEIDERGTVKKIPRSQIQTINFASEPRELRAGRDAAMGDKYDEALENLAKVKAEDISRNELKQELAFYTAYSKAKLSLAGSDRAAAEKELLEFVTANGESFHFYEAAELLGELAYAGGSYENAVKRYAALAKSSAPDVQMRGGYWEGKSLLAKGDAAGALTKFELVIAMPHNEPSAASVKALCEIGKARCLVETGKAPEGIAIAQGIIDRNDPKDRVLFGEAYNALGLGQLKAEQKKSAVIAFLHVDLLFPSEPQTHAEALYHLEKLWTEQGKVDRAQECRNTLKEQYGGTVWATKG